MEYGTSTWLSISINVKESNDRQRDLKQETNNEEKEDASQTCLTNSYYKTSRSVVLFQEYIDNTNEVS